MVLRTGVSVLPRAQTPAAPAKGYQAPRAGRTRVLTNRGEVIWRIAAEVSWIETAEVDPVRLRDSFRIAPIPAIPVLMEFPKPTFVQVTAIDWYHFQMSVSSTEPALTDPQQKLGAVLIPDR